MGAWEDSLALFAPADFSVTSRVPVGNDGEETWFGSPGQMSDSVNGLWDFSVILQQRTVTNSNTYGVTSQTSMHYWACGVNLRWSYFEDKNGPLYKFVHQPEDILTPLVCSPNETPTTSIWSFDAASDALRGVDAWLCGWEPQFNAWADGLGDTGSDWKGTAAGVFKALLQGFGHELETLHMQLSAAKSFADAIDTSRIELNAVLLGLFNAYVAWRSSPLVWPAACVNTVVNDVVDQVNRYLAANTTTDFGSIQTTYGVLGTQKFWDGVQSQAKKVWRNNVESHLDSIAAPAIGQLSSSYQSTNMVLARPIIPAKMTLPVAKEPDPTNGPSNGLDNFSKGLNDFGEGLDKFGSSMGDGINKFATNFAGGLSKFGDGMSHGMSTFGDSLSKLGSSPHSPLPPGKPGVPVPKLTSPPPMPGAPFAKPGLPSAKPGLPSAKPGLPSARPGMPLSSGNDQMLTDRDGNPLRDSSGNLIMVPAGSHVGPDGTVIGPDGKPVKGRDGKPLKVSPHSVVKPTEILYGPDGRPLRDANGKELVVPAGSKVMPDGTVVDSKGHTLRDAHGKPITVPKGSTVRPAQHQPDFTPGTPSDTLTLPPGSKVNPDGTVVDSKGNPLNDPYGKPMILPRGSSITANGTVIGPDGRPMSASAEARNELMRNIADRDRAIRDSSLAEQNLLRRSLNMPGGFRPTSPPGVIPDTGLGKGPRSPLTILSDLSPRARNALTGFTTAETEAQVGSQAAGERRAAVAAEEAAREAQMMGRGSTSSGMPMIPPMGGMGAPAPGGQNERTRTTWLSEDEEVWGTAEQSGTSGVIGR